MYLTGGEQENPSAERGTTKGKNNRVAVAVPRSDEQEGEFSLVGAENGMMEVREQGVAGVEELEMGGGLRREG